MNQKQNIDILHIEDNIDEAKLVARVLEKEGITTNYHQLNNGAAALDFFFRTNPFPDMWPKIILLDIKLPKINGLDVLAKLKANDRTKAIPIIILSASAQERDVAEAYRLGANSYLVKPVKYNHFKELLQTLGQYWLRHNTQKYV
ncbi:MAG: response regulator [Anaerolineae bacterium]|nr:response regulator [Anaerolineae bacterium]